VFLSENILNLFTFYEIMAISSYFLIIHEEDEYSHRAGASYLTISIAGGLMLLLGILISYNYAGTLIISEMDLSEASQATRTAIGILILVGFGFKASLYPLHFWLPKAYTAAPISATIVLSAVLAKTGIFGMILTLHYTLGGDRNLSLGVLALSMITILIGGILALYQRNIKRTLAYSSMSQMGYMLLSFSLIELLGDHGAIAVYGTLFHVVNHGIIKALLFMLVGVLYMVLSEYSINSIYGCGRFATALKGFFLVGALAIIGFPGLNGYASKTMIHDALLEAADVLPGPMFPILNVLFYVGSALTVAYMTKLFVALFVEKNPVFETQRIRLHQWQVILPLSLLSVMVLFLGIRADLFFQVFAKASAVLGLEGEVTVKFFSSKNLTSSLFVFLAGIGIYFLIVWLYQRRKVEGRVVYRNPTSTYFTIEEGFIIPVVGFLYKLLLAFFQFFDQWLIRFFQLMNRIIGWLFHTASEQMIKLSTKEEVEEPEPEPEPEPVPATTPEPTPAPALIMEQGPSMREKVGVLVTEGETTVRKTVLRSRRKLDTLTYSVFIFGGILVLSLIFVFLNSTLI
jgi:formate hydrogenlyase subunit 3/multisubunit Na+/H+ antiporter MnhD subunit